jgi:segregation and condensation protein A
VAPPPEKEEDGPLAPLPVFNLFDAFSKLLERRQLKMDHQITFDRLTITDRMNQLVELLMVRKRLVFEELFDDVQTRFDLVITFLALLEMTKLKMTRLFQTEAYQGLYIEYAVTEDDSSGEEAAEGESDNEQP